MIKKILSICISVLITVITIISIYFIGWFLVKYFNLNYDWSILHAIFIYLIGAMFNVMMKY